MQIRVKDIPGRGKEVEDRIPADALGFPEDVRFAEPVSVVVRLEKSGTQINVNGRVWTVMACECHRCVEPYLQPLEVPVEAYFIPRPPGVDVEGSEAQLGLFYYDDDRVDLEPYLRDAVLLEIPMKQLCRPDCEGLCATCGENRNTGACGCERTGEGPQNPFAEFFRERGMGPAGK